MASAELVIAFSARLDGLESSISKVNTSLANLERTSQNAATNIQQAGQRSSSAWESAAGSIRNYAAAWVTIQGLTVTGRFLSSISDLEGSFNRLQLQLGGMPALARQTFGALTDIAVRTGQPLQGVVDQFTRFQVALASSNIPVTVRDMEKLVETLQNFARLSTGASGGMAITQLAQGLASGRLQGDELRSIMENMPLLAQALARELNVSVGELRKMGEEGRLVTSNVLPALIRAGDRMAEQMRGVPLTLAQSFQSLLTNTMSFITNIDTAIGGTEFLSRVLTMGSNYVRQMAVATGMANPRDTIGGLTRDINNAQEAVNRLAQAMRDLPAAPEGDSPSQNAARGRIEARRATLQRQIDAQLADIQRFEIQRLGIESEGDRESTIQNLNNLESARTASEASFARELEAARRAGSDQYRIRAESHERIRGLMDQYATYRQSHSEQENRIARGEMNAAIRLEQERADREIAQLGAADARRAEAAQRREETEAARTLARLNRLRELVQRQGDPLDQLRVNMTSENRMTGLREFFLDDTMAAEGMRTAVGYATEQIRNFFNALNERGRGPATGIDEARRSIEDMSRLLFPNAGPARQTFVEQADAQIEPTLERMRQKFQTWYDLAKDGVTKFSSALADSIVDFATTGSANFAKMAEDFAKAIAKMILNAMIFRAIMLSLRAVGIDLMMPQPRMAGGEVTAGEPYIVGERQPELFVPGSSGYVFPTAGRSGEVTVNVFNNAPNTRATARESNDGSGGKTIEIFVEEVVNRGIATGKFDNTMGASFGAARIGRV
jgi:tape measure domain-containing protein